MVTSIPSLDNTWAQLNPAGPAPTIATFFPTDGLRSNSCQLFSNACAVEYCCSLAIWIGSSSNKLNTQAPSHNFSTGQTLAHPAPMIFEERIVCAEPFTLSVVICLMNFGTSICVGQLLVHGAS